MKNKMLLPIVLFLLVAAIAFPSYRLIEKQFAPPGETILFVPKVGESDEQTEFWKVVHQGVLAAAEEYDVSVTMEGAASELDVEGQIRILEDAISAKPAAIVLAAADYYRLVPTAKKIKAAGIKIITVDSGLSGGHAVSFVGTDNIAAGRKVADMMKSFLRQGDSIAVINFVEGSATAMERERGVMSSIQSDGSLRVVATLYCDGSAEKAYALTRNLLRSHPEIKGIIGLNEPSTVGAARAVREYAGNNGGDTIYMVGFDSSTEEVAFLEDGILHAIVVQRPFNMGYLAIKTALEAVRGKKVSETIDTGSVVVTRKTIYTRENQKLLFPFADQ